MSARELAQHADPDEKSQSEAMESWTLDQRLLAMLANIMAGANWQRGGGKGPKPDLFSDGHTSSTQHIGGKSPLTREQKRAALQARAPKREE